MFQPAEIAPWKLKLPPKSSKLQNRPHDAYFAHVEP